MSQPDSSGDVRLSYAVGPDGEMVSVKDVPSGRPCGCRCPGCMRPLIAKNRRFEGRVVAYHFAHEGDHSCKGAYESMVHRLAKDVIAADRGVNIPTVEARHNGETRVISEEHWLIADTVTLEAWRDGIRPDIIARHGEDELAIEIFVTHRCDDEKLAIIRERGMATIEIDLSGMPRNVELSELREPVRRAARRYWIFNPKQAGHDADLKRHIEARDRKEQERRLRDTGQRRKEHLKALITAIGGGRWDGGDIAWDEYLDTEIPGSGRPRAICFGPERDFQKFVSRIRALNWIHDESLPESSDNVGLPLARAMERARFQRWRKAEEREARQRRARAAEQARLLRARAEEESLAEIASLRKQEEDRRAAEKRRKAAEAAAEIAAQRRREQTELEKALLQAKERRIRALRAEIEAHAIETLRDKAPEWLERAGLDRLAALDDAGSGYRQALADELLGIALEAERKDAQRLAALPAKLRPASENRTRLENRALVKFGSRDRATVWVCSLNPALGGRPVELCEEKGGFDRCMAALK